MSSENLVAPNRSAHLDRRTLVRGLAALTAPALGTTLFAHTALAGGKKAKRKQKKNGRRASVQGCGGSCK